MSTPLRELVDRVRSAPAGPQVAAVFDYDGTLIDGFSGYSFIKDRFWRGKLGPREAGKIAQAVITGVHTPEEFVDFLDWSLEAYAGRNVEELQALGRKVYDDDIANRLRPEAWALLETHRLAGHTLILASSGTAIQLEAIAQATGIDHVIATEFEVVDDVATGRITGQPPWGPFKADAVAKLAATLDVDLDRSFAYSDGDEDIPLLSGVGNPTAVSPRPHLLRHARARGWPVLQARPVGSGAPLTSAARSVAMLCGFAGGTVLAGPVGLLRRSTRAFIDGAIGAASDLSLTLAGVHVAVAGGEEYLFDARPCVFVFNHRSNLDAVVLMHLLRHDVTAIAKQEVADVPGIGQLFGMADVAFIDRSDSTQARQAIQPAVDSVRERGLSLVLAPEATRWRTPGLGQFKKGAFHIARQAGVPVVPVVLAGTAELLPKGSQMIRPGTVRVEVLAPIDPSTWQPSAMAQEVAAVRERMLCTLVDLIAA